MGSIEPDLVDLLKRADLQGFETILAAHQITKVRHLDNVTDGELERLGFFIAAVRRLRNEAKNQAAFKYIDSIPKHAVRIQTNLKLGSGQFGIVYKAIWQKDEHQKIECAVKCLNESGTPEDKEEFYKEMTSMQKLIHNNIVRFYGVIIDSPIFMVMEYCDGGALLERLKNHKYPLLLTTMINYAEQIVDGMTFLANQRFIHRDIAARNILLTKNEKVVKIGDLGLARFAYDNVYLQEQKRKLPIAWTAPEALINKCFTHSSDVWAFGVTLWEMFSYGEEPWSTISPMEILSELKRGTRLRRPKKCPMPVFDLMLKCWHGNPDQRPPFSQIKEDLPKLQLEFYDCLELYQNVDYEILPATKLFLVSNVSHDIFYVQNLSNAKFVEVPYYILKRIEDLSIVWGKKTKQTYFSSIDGRAEEVMVKEPVKTHQEPSKKQPPTVTPPLHVFIPPPDYNLKVPSPNSPDSSSSIISDSGCGSNFNMSRDASFADTNSTGYKTAESVASGGISLVGKSVSMDNVSQGKRPFPRLDVLPKVNENGSKPKFFLGEANRVDSRENFLAELSKKVEKPVLLPPKVDMNMSSESIFTSRSEMGRKTQEIKESKPKNEEKQSIFSNFKFKLMKPLTFPTISDTLQIHEPISAPTVMVTTPSPTTFTIPPLPLNGPPLPKDPPPSNKPQRRPTRRQFDRSRRKSLVKSGGGTKAVAVVKELIEKSETAVVGPPALPKKPSGSTTFPAHTTNSPDPLFGFPSNKISISSQNHDATPPPPVKPRTTSTNHSKLSTSQPNLFFPHSSENAATLPKTFGRKFSEQPLPLPPAKLLPKISREDGRDHPPPLPPTPAPVALKKREIGRNATDTGLNTSSASLIQDIQRKLNLQGLQINQPFQPSTSSSPRSLPPSPDTYRRPRPALLPKPPRREDSSISNMLNRSHPVLPLLRNDMPRLLSAPRLETNALNHAPPVPPRRNSTRSATGFIMPKMDMPIKPFLPLETPMKPILPLESPSSPIRFRNGDVSHLSRVSTDSWTEPEETEDEYKPRAKLDFGKKKNKRKSPYGYAKSDLSRSPGRATIKKKEKQKKILEDTLKLDIQKRLSGENGIALTSTSPKVKEKEPKSLFTKFKEIITKKSSEMKKRSDSDNRKRSNT